MKKKIALVVSGLANGGVEIFIKNYFSNMEKDNMDLYIITHNIPNENIKKSFESLGFKILSITPRKKNLFKNIIELNKIFKSYKFDIVHSHMATSNYLPLLLAKINKVKIRISHSHMMMKNTNIKNKIIMPIIRFLNRITANEYVACSKDAFEYAFGKNKKEVNLLYNAIDLSRFTYNEKNKIEVRKKYNIDEDVILIGNIARFTNVKNQEYLLYILKKILKQDNRYKLMLIGEGELENHIINLSKELKIEDHITIVKPLENIEKFYSAFDLFVLPSKFEGLGMVLIEAQVSGLASFASDTIPREAMQSELIQFISLNNIDEWCKKIMNYQPVDRKLNYINNENYDIKVQYKKLQSMYEDR